MKRRRTSPIARLARVRAHLNTKKKSLASVALAKMKIFKVAGKGQLKCHQKRDARVPLVATVFDASSRLEARVPFLLPRLLAFLHEDVDVFGVVIVERRAKRKDAHQ